MKNTNQDPRNVTGNSRRFAAAKRVAMLPWLLVAAFVCNAHLNASNTYDINVGTGGSDADRSVNWGERSGPGTWGVSRESFLGFTLVSMINGVEAGELSWGGNLRSLGVGGDGSVGNTASINRTRRGDTIEAIRLELPAAGARVGVPGGGYGSYGGISGIAFDRLSLGSGSEVTITGFAGNPEARWAVDRPETLVYDAARGRLSFTTTDASDDYGVIRLSNLDATLSEGGVSLVISNEKHGNNAYGLVGWQYVAVPEVEADGARTGE